MDTTFVIGCILGIAGMCVLAVATLYACVRRWEQKCPFGLPEDDDINWPPFPECEECGPATLEDCACCPPHGDEPGSDPVPLNDCIPWEQFAEDAYCAYWQSWGLADHRIWRTLSPDIRNAWIATVQVAVNSHRAWQRAVCGVDSGRRAGTK